MILKTPGAEILRQEDGVTGLFRHIERCGRVCYRSEDKITDESNQKFLLSMINSGHHSVLEHGTVYLKISIKNPLYDMHDYDKLSDDVAFYKNNPYSRVVCVNETEFVESNIEIKVSNYYVTTNFRVIIENDRMNDIFSYGCNKTKSHIGRITVKFVCDIGVSREFNRHRTHSISEESTRYCNYSKGKFGNEISFIIPSWYYTMTQEEQSTYYEFLQNAELAYMKLIDSWKQAQKARIVLPLNTATTLVHTAYVDDWYTFIDMRYHGTTGAPHPQAKELAGILKDRLHDEVLK